MAKTKELRIPTYVLITTNQEPRIGVIKTYLPYKPNFLDIDAQGIIVSLKEALSDHFDCDQKKVIIDHIDVESTVPLKINVNCIIPDVDDCSDEIIVSLEEIYVYLT